MGRPLPEDRDARRRRRAPGAAGDRAHLLQPLPRRAPVRGRVVGDRRPRPPGRGRLPLVRGPGRRHHHHRRLPGRPVRGRVRAGLPSRGRRGRRGPGAGRRARLGGPRDRRARATASPPTSSPASCRSTSSGVTAPYKYPRIVEFADELPKTPSGKIKRAELRGHAMSDGEWASFAGIFIVTNLGLLAVGATLAVLPHYVKDNLQRLRSRGRDRQRRLRLHRDRLPPDRGQPRRPPRPQADRDRRRPARGDRRVVSTSSRPGSRG